jgi:hypothetical protein
MFLGTKVLLVWIVSEKFYPKEVEKEKLHDNNC